MNVELYLENGRCFVAYGDCRLEVVGFTVSSLKSGVYGRTDYAARVVKVEDGRAVAISEVGEFAVRFFEGAYGLSFVYEFVPSQTIERLDCVAIDLKLNQTIDVAVYSEEQYTVCSHNVLTQTSAVKFLDGQDVCATEYLSFRCDSGKIGVVGVTTYERYRAMLLLHKNGLVRVFCVVNEGGNADEYRLNAGEKVCSDRFVVVFDEVDALEKYGKEIAAIYGNRNVGRLTGWSSWSYYFGNVSEEKILENVAVAKENNLPVEYIQVDDGWQKRYGDWTANERFPHGMKYLAEEIGKAGFKAGIWVAPFWADKESEIYQNHPDWFVVGEERKYIDFTKAEPQKWLHFLFHTLSREWGYRFIKIDFVSNMVTGNGYERGNHLNVCRKAFEIIRSAVTEDTVILSGTAPLGYLAGLVDSVRTGVDIHENWQAVRHEARYVLRRAYIYEYAGVDADCLLLRESNEEAEDCRLACTRNRVELNTFITFIIVSNGTVFNSDRLALLSEEKIETLRNLFSLQAARFQALDLYERDIPSVFRAKEGGGEVYAFINWEDVEKEFTLPLAKERKQRFAIGGEERTAKTVKVKLQPHASEIVCVGEIEKDYGKVFLK